MKSEIAASSKNLSSSHCDQKGNTPITQGNLREVDRNPKSQLMLGNVGVGIVISDSCGTITLANPAAKRLAQIDPEGKSLAAAPSIWGELFDASGRHVPVKQWPCMRALRGETTVGLECRLIRTDRSGSNILFGSCPIGEPGSNVGGTFSSLTNVTEQRRREVSLREDAVLGERSRLATEIHDTLLQGLNAVVLQLEVLEQEFQNDPDEALAMLRRARKTARETLVEARRSMWVLSHEPADEQDPAASLGFIAEKLFTGVPIALQLHLQERPGLDSQLRLALVRIGKEALTNVLKHSRATSVCVELAYRGKEVSLSVLDNGCGFTGVPFVQAQGGFGLFGLKARAEQLGGKVLVHSRPGWGTRILATIPLRRESHVDPLVQ